MKLAYIAILLVALAGCQSYETGPDSEGKAMVYEAPKTIMQAPGMFAVMVRGNVYTITPEGEKQGWRVTTKKETTFSNVAPQDERGAVDAVLHIARQMGVTCEPPSKLVVQRDASRASYGETADSQYWLLSPGCS
ncbi:hypothetical protein ACMA5I_03540 [Paracoccaceae bacterium GXU_MW_L88]